MSNYACSNVNLRSQGQFPETPRVPLTGSYKGSLKGSIRYRDLYGLGFRGLQYPLIKEYTIIVASLI